VSERSLPLAELVEAHRSGALTEAFGTGTAAVVAPIGELGLDDRRLVIGRGRIGELAARLYSAITAIQVGSQPDPYQWVEEV
jgi:branched-chain amino acid aminotransferase